MDCPIRAARPQSVHSSGLVGPQSRADRPRLRNGPGAVRPWDNYSSVPGHSSGYFALSRTPSRVCPGTCGTPGPADQARRTGRQDLGLRLERPSGLLRVKPGQSRAHGASLRSRDPGAGRSRQHCKERLGRRGAAGQGYLPGAAASCLGPGPAHGTTNREPVTRSHGSFVSLQNPGRAPRHGRTRPQHSGLSRLA